MPFLRPTDADLRNLDIDPEVFVSLPRAVQREQLTRARLTKAGGVPEVSGERLTLKLRKYLPPPDLFRQPPPHAKYPAHATSSPPPVPPTSMRDVRGEVNQ